MNYALAADAVVLLHFLFVAFGLAGGALVIRWPKVAFAHLPCAIWGAWIEFSGGICPLTPLEIRYRMLAGEQGYEGGFVAHYLLPVLYPEGLTREDQVMLGLFFVTINILFYNLAWRRHRARRQHFAMDRTGSPHGRE